jgi:ABC-type nitrate/sulfonate/bicarbonate transport system permease component
LEVTVRLTSRVGVLRWDVILFALVGWEIVARALGSQAYLAPPSRVFTTGLAYLGRADTLDGLGVTTVRFLAAFAMWWAHCGSGRRSACWACCWPS